MTSGASSIETHRTIPLTRGVEAMVDAADYGRLSAIKWHAHECRGTFYAANGGGKQGRVFMHRLVCDAPKGLQVDHINGNSLDNRRANLRPCVDQQNRWNRGARANSASGIKGVMLCRRTGRWAAAITANGKRHYLGSYADQADAARAYDAAALHLHGAFARLNFPEAV